MAEIKLLHKRTLRGPLERDVPLNDDLAAICLSDAKKMPFAVRQYVFFFWPNLGVNGLTTLNEAKGKRNKH